VSSFRSVIGFRLLVHKCPNEICGCVRISFKLFLYIVTLLHKQNNKVQTGAFRLNKQWVKWEKINANDINLLGKLNDGKDYTRVLSARVKDARLTSYPNLALPGAAYRPKCHRHSVKKRLWLRLRRPLSKSWPPMCRRSLVVWHRGSKLNLFEDSKDAVKFLHVFRDDKLVEQFLHSFSCNTNIHIKEFRSSNIHINVQVIKSGHWDRWQFTLIRWWCWGKVERIAQPVVARLAKANKAFAAKNKRPQHLTNCQSENPTLGLLVEVRGLHQLYSRCKRGAMREKRTPVIGTYTHLCKVLCGVNTT
jgi:hypothetical protein